MANVIDSSHFSVVTSAEWKARADKELKDKSYDDYLVWKSLDGFEIEAWQNQLPKRLCKLQPLDSPWKSLTMISINDAQLANKAALHSLMSGGEAVWFTKSFLGAAEEVVKNGIDRSIAPVFIAGNTICDPYHSLLKTGSESNTTLENQVVFDGKRLRERGCNAVQELALIIAQALEWCAVNGFDREVFFKVSNGSAYLTEIAKVRALRWLWSSVLEKENLPVSNPSIIATNLNIGYAQNDEHTNILRATTSAISAVCGGAQFIMVEPWDSEWKASNEFSERITRNIQNLLKDESRMANNLNPANGSYFIENLTTTIAENAWKMVQRIEQNGGFSKYAISGLLKAEIEETRNKMIEDYSTGSKVLLNVNKYNSSEQIIEKCPQKSVYELLPNYLFLPTEIKKK